jgi:hypothetical protein
MAQLPTIVGGLWAGFSTIFIGRTYKRVPDSESAPRKILGLDHYKTNSPRRELRFFISRSRPAGAVKIPTVLPCRLRRRNEPSGRASMPARGMSWETKVLATVSGNHGRALGFLVRLRQS